MPSIAEEHPRLMLPGRKRRRDNDVNDLQLQGPLYEKLAQYSAAAAAASDNWNADGAFGRPVQQQLQQQQPNFFPRFPGHNDRLIFQHGGSGTAEEQQHHNLDANPRKIAPLPVSKRQRMFDDEDTDADSNWGANTTTTPQRQRRQSKSPSSQLPPRVQDQTDAGNRPKTPSSLSPCHICHRRPTKKSDLDSFADCQGCSQRTCYICIRDCQGWKEDGRPNHGDNLEQEDALSRSFHMDDIDDEQQRQRDEKNDGGVGDRKAKRQDGWTGGGHRQMVCSRCCIEKGAEGDVVCLGCLSLMESV